MDERRWDEDSYLRIVSACYDQARDTLTVTFRNGDTVTLSARCLLRSEQEHIDWPSMEIVGNYHLDVPARPHHLEISGFAIRALTDAAFSAHLAAQAEQEARQVGRRLREMRKARGLSAKEVAARAGLSAQSISRIELGQHDVVLTTLEKILAVMGYTLRDLAEQTEPATVSA